MKVNQWTLSLAALGLVSLGTVGQADEAQNVVQTALSSTTISGYVSTSAILRFGSGNITPGRSYDGASKQDGFNFDVAKLQIEKPLDESNWSAGYQLGLLFGPDANTLGTTSEPGENNSDFGISDANVTLRVPVGNGLDFKAGYWQSPVGYEVFDSGNNPNYSRSYGYYIEPKQFTGVLATYHVSEVISLAGGIANCGWNLSHGPEYGLVSYQSANNINLRSKPDNEGVFSYIGSVAITAPESAGFLKGATLYGGIVNSGVYQGGNVINYYVGGTMPTPLDGLLLGAAFDYRSNSDEGSIAAAHAYAVSGYASYRLSEKLKLNARAEYAKGSNNTWYYTSTYDYDGDFGDSGGYDYGKAENELFGLTATLDYTLWANVLSRLEFRWDHELSGNGIFNDGTDENAISLALNLIYKF